MPDGSKTDTLLAKAKPISDGGCASGITYLRRGEVEKLGVKLSLGRSHAFPDALCWDGHAVKDKQLGPGGKLRDKQQQTN
ncbi:hypothetical protein llap_4036 [Limosa lapponica baueri]|uniref:Uncharacterized protein n=1 Tax=Limosa lapponica baueri TaxID=1758121 RepID=A0A2I0UHZ4_LIMLA|nr:hypothetical protein llap_4036 [Limosa lapponica baueri]